MRALALIVLLLSVTTAQTNCMSVLEYDARQECLARERRDPSICNGIADTNRRRACFTEQRGDPSGCSDVLNPVDRERCRQRAGQRGLSPR
jgi:hypothetical protein